MQQPSDIVTLCAVDIETLGTALHSPIIQIGAAFASWDRAKETLTVDAPAPIYWQFDSDNSGLLRSQEGLKNVVGISGSTMAFHFGNTTYRTFEEKVKVAGVEYPVITYGSAQHAMDGLSKRIKETDAYVMAQNNEFDLAMLKGNSDLVFYNHQRTLDIRTFQCLGLLPKKLSAKTHNALEDAIAELEEVVGLLKSGKITLC